MKVFHPSISGTEPKKIQVFSPTVITPSKPKNHTERKENEKKKRKTRIDKKTDIKVPVTIEQKQKLMILSKLQSVHKDQRISVTQMGTELVQKGLLLHETFPAITYKASLKPVHVKLERFYAEQLFNLQLEWDVSMREAAARVLSFMLEKQGDKHEL